MLYSEFSLIVISIVIIVFFLFLSSIKLNSSKSELSKMPELSYNFPSLYISSFLNEEISQSDVKELGLTSSRKYYIKDLLYFDNKKYSPLIEKYRINYITDSNRENNENNMHFLFKKFSNFNYQVNSDNLLHIIHLKNLQSVEKLSNVIRDNNYYFVIKTKNGNYVLIEFESQDINIISTGNDLNGI